MHEVPFPVAGKDPTMMSAWFMPASAQHPCKTVDACAKRVNAPWKVRKAVGERPNPSQELVLLVMVAEMRPSAMLLRTAMFLQRPLRPALALVQRTLTHYCYCL